MRGTEFAELHAFLAVAERRSFARAAEALNLAPSTLSQTIRALEKRLDIRLLNRTTRSVSLTDAGEKLYARLRPAFGEVYGAVEATRDLRDKPAGILRLSVSTIPAHMILAPLLGDFRAAYPDITLDIEIDDAGGDLASGRFDAGIRYGRRIAPHMKLVKVSNEARIIAVAAPSYIKAHGAPKTPDELQNHNCIRYRIAPQEIIAWGFEKNKKAIEIEVNGGLIVNSPALIVAAARAGAGIGYTIEEYVAEDIRKDTLVPLLSDWSPVQHSYYLYHASNPRLPAPLKVFIEFIQSRRRVK